MEHWPHTFLTSLLTHPRGHFETFSAQSIIKAFEDSPCDTYKHNAAKQCRNLRFSHFTDSIRNYAHLGPIGARTWVAAWGAGPESKIFRRGAFHVHLCQLGPFGDRTRVSDEISRPDNA